LGAGSQGRDDAGRTFGVVFNRESFEPIDQFTCSLAVALMPVKAEFRPEPPPSDRYW
jgi:hypothetical protein